MCSLMPGISHQNLTKEEKELSNATDLKMKCIETKHSFFLVTCRNAETSTNVLSMGERERMKPELQKPKMRKKIY